MRFVSYMLVTATMFATPQLLGGQSVNAGRGEVPLTLPAGYSDESPAPLIVSLHGFGGTGQSHDAYLKLSGLADSYGFVLVAPDGLASEGVVFGMKNPRFWNATKACCDLGGVEQDDSAYLARLIEAIKAEVAVDPKRVFLVGHSNGAFMSYRLARDHSESIAAMVSLAGAEEPGDTEAPGDPNVTAALASPVHVLQIHGTADAMITYGGGQIQGLGAFAGARETVEKWAKRNGCSGTGEDVGTVDLVRTLGGAETTITRFTNDCRAGGSVELWTIAQGSHMPAFTAHFSALVVEWLLGHPKP